MQYLLEVRGYKVEIFSRIESCVSLEELEKIRIEVKNGDLKKQLKNLNEIESIEDRKRTGSELNQAIREVEDALKQKKYALETANLNEQLKSETLDVTLPPRPEKTGKIHPISQVLEEITAIFADMGFSVAEGPAIEDDYHNFTALNFPEGHPAREMHDTFYLKSSEFRVQSSENNNSTPLNSELRTPNSELYLLRTHTSPVQNRTMKAGKPPFRFIAPGVTFRCDSDMTHTPMFHQFEGVVIDKNIHMGHLKGCVRDFLKAFFEIEGELPLRFRPSFFPFTEPSAEIDIGCSRENGELRIGAGKDWLEVAGCGMIHANVLTHGGIDPKEWQGFAFGFGVERLAMLKYGIPDLRTFFASDVRWLSHYGFDALDVPNLAGGLSK